MCGIIGILGRSDVTDSLVAGLRRLEYRGYDSAGVCTLINGGFDRRRAARSVKPGLAQRFHQAMRQRKDEQN